MIIQYMVYIEVDRIKPITYIDMKTQKKFNVLALTNAFKDQTNFSGPYCVYFITDHGKFTKIDYLLQRKKR
jgi:hypothetical protein